MHTHTIYTHIYYFFLFFSLIGYYKILSIVPCAIEIIFQLPFYNNHSHLLLPTVIAVNYYLEV